jgi:hypothetical protein
MKQTHIDVLKHGTIGGLLGYFVIALYYAAFNVVNGRSAFYTVAALGEAMFDPRGVLPTAGAVIAYNGVNLLFFLLLGIVAAWLIYEVELHPGLWYAALLTLITAFLFTSGTMAIVAGTLASVSVLVVLLGNLFAAAALAGYLAWRHRGLERRIERLSDVEVDGWSEPVFHSRTES